MRQNAVLRSNGLTPFSMLFQLYHKSHCAPIHVFLVLFTSTLQNILSNEWCLMPLSKVFQSYNGDSSHYSCLSWVSPVLGWGSEVSCPRTLPRKTQRIWCCPNPGPLDYQSDTPPLSHAGPQIFFLSYWLLSHITTVRTMDIMREE